MVVFSQQVLKATISLSFQQTSDFLGKRTSDWKTNWQLQMVILADTIEAILDA